MIFVFIRIVYHKEHTFANVCSHIIRIIELMDINIIIEIMDINIIIEKEGQFLSEIESPRILAQRS